MKNVLIKIIMTILLLIFLGSSGMAIRTYLQYKKGTDLYSDTAQNYTKKTDGRKTDTADDGNTAAIESDISMGNVPPIEVDFDELRKINPEIVGWIYCEGTEINYPILQADDNDKYLHRGYDGNYLLAGSIFVDALNQPGFVDHNTIIYGHHMKNGSMFAGLDKWQDQTYYEEHPYMWIFTPQQNYKLYLFSGYTTAAVSETYTIFTGTGEEFENYLYQMAAKSNFAPTRMPGAETHGEGTALSFDINAPYVVLSTCAYNFEDARYVLHGVLSQCLK